MFKTLFSMQQKAICVEKWSNHSLFTAVNKWYIQKHGFPALSANFLKDWFHKFHESGTKANRLRSGSPAISDDDVARIANTFQENTRELLRVVNTKLSFSVSKIHDVIRKIETLPLQDSYYAPAPSITLSFILGLRIEYSCWNNKHSEYYKIIVFSDNRIFQTNEVVNKNNSRG